MLLSFGLMGGSVIGLALTPSYAAIGPAAPLLAVLFRLLQGFGLGGEVGPSTAFLMEAAPRGKAGLYVSLQFATQEAATLAAGLAGLLLASVMSAEGLDQWGWRIALLAGSVLVPMGLILRKGLPETMEATSPRLLPRLTGAQARAALLGFFMLAAATISFYTITYLVTFATRTLALPPRIAFGATVVTGLCGTLFCPLGGWLSDRFGSRKIMLAGYTLLLLVTLPCFTMMAASRAPWALYASAALMTTFYSLGVSAILAALARNLPPLSRSGGIGIVYALAISIFGGSAQFVVTWLIGVLHSPLAPAWYLSGALLVGIAAMLAMPVAADGAEADPIKIGA
jgi:MFS family permease